MAMNAGAQQLLNQVRMLSTKEQEEIAAALLMNLPGPPDSRTDDEWTAEIAKRVKDMEDPHFKKLSWDEVRSGIEKHLRDTRRR